MYRDRRATVNKYGKIYQKSHSERANAFEDECVKIAETKVGVSMTPEQKNYFKVMFSNMDSITALHVIESANMGMNLVDSYESKHGEGSFEKDFSISPNNFALGMLLHDTGKLTINPEILLTQVAYAYDSDEAIKMQGHSLNAIDVINTVNQMANPGSNLRDIFDPKSTDIALYHHPKNFGPNFDTSRLSPYIMAAVGIDIYEACVTDTRLYKDAMPSEKAMGFVKFDQQKYFGKNEEKMNFINTFIDEIPKLRDEDFHKFLTTKFGNDISLADDLGKDLDANNPRAQLRLEEQKAKEEALRIAAEQEAEKDSLEK